MSRIILIFGIVAGVVVAVPMCLMAANSEHGSAAQSYFTGYLILVLALSLIFVGVKRLRDRELGGVIRFVPALLAGLGISAVAGVIYAIGWEITLAVTDFAFIDSYSNAAVEAARAKGASAAEVQAVIAQMDEFRRQYANPFFRLPMTFVEIFPVGVLISLISAGLLRNSRFLPARDTGRVQHLAPGFQSGSSLTPAVPVLTHAGLMMNRDRRSAGMRRKQSRTRRFADCATGAGQRTRRSGRESGDPLRTGYSSSVQAGATRRCVPVRAVPGPPRDPGNSRVIRRCRDS